MKKQFIFIAAFIVIALSSCDRYYNPGLNVKTVVEDTLNVGTEFEVLTRFLHNSGEYINSKGIPNMVSAEDVNDNLSSYYVLDIRSHEEYVDGHINGAVNIQASEIIDFLDKNVSPSEYDKLIIACHSGQTASYVTSILRLIGYNNVYAMKYGMGAWNRSLDKWSPNVSNKYANQLETKANPKGKVTPYPVLATGKHCGAEVLAARAKTVLETPFKKLKINADRAFSDTTFYIVNYWPEEKYAKGHIPGSVQYTPKKDLTIGTSLNTLPSDKKILVYCFTGQKAAFIIAYLRLLGYNAYTLGFGANAFMHGTLTSKEGWHGFKAADKLNDFALVKGENPTDKAFETKINNTGGANDAPKAKKKIKKRKKKEVEGGCG
jgi:rhodanese-related sulfurtransferase